jgi:hypothetical protein
MIRSLAVILLLAGCLGGDRAPVPTGTGGSTPAPTGGTTATGGTSASGGSTGTGGTTPTGGTTATGGTIGGAVDSGSTSYDAPMSVDAIMSTADGGTSSGGGDGGYMPGGDILPARPYIHLCPKDWDQMKCCEFLCECLANYCTDSPMDKPRTAHDVCMNMCTKLADARARCQVFHCFESKSPTAVADHASHCGHASGRVGGGDCSLVK